MRNKSIVFIILVLVVIILFIQGKVDTLSFLFLLSLIIILNLTIYLFLFIKTVEAAAMLKLIPPEELTEGDWIANNVNYKGKYITGPEDLGISKKKISSQFKTIRDPLCTLSGIITP